MSLTVIAVLVLTVGALIGAINAYLMGRRIRALEAKINGGM